MKKKPFDFRPIRSPRELREQGDMNQSDFWKQFGVTQSAGSRYENGRDMPHPLTALVRSRYPRAR